MLECLGERRYVADIQAEKEGQIYIFEIDGVRGHSTRRNRTKDKTRDGALLELNRRTIRLPTWWIVGKGKLSDREILKEIEYQNAQYNVSLLLTENKTV
jgi:very-short-patch-repair endonuclease